MSYPILLWEGTTPIKMVIEQRFPYLSIIDCSNVTAQTSMVHLTPNILGFIGVLLCSLLWSKLILLHLTNQQFGFAYRWSKSSYQKQTGEANEKLFYKGKGCGAREIHRRLSRFAGKSEGNIQENLRSISIKTQLRTSFTNKAPFTPITAEQVMERIQIDKSSDSCLANDGKEYRYILTVLDVMS